MCFAVELLFGWKHVSVEQMFWRVLQKLERIMKNIRESRRSLKNGINRISNHVFNPVFMVSDCWPNYYPVVANIWYAHIEVVVKSFGLVFPL